MIWSILSIASSGGAAPRTSRTVEIASTILTVVLASKVTSIDSARSVIFVRILAISDDPRGPPSWDALATAEERAPTMDTITSCRSSVVAVARSFTVAPGDDTRAPRSLISWVRFLVASAVVRLPLFLLRSSAAVLVAPVFFVSTFAVCDGTDDGDGDDDDPLPLFGVPAAFAGDGEGVTDATQDASSATAEPGRSTWPDPQDVTALRTHVLVSSLPLNVPLAQSLQAASSADALPASYPLPAPQDWTVLYAHVLVSSLVLNMPAAQSMHPALSTLVVPATNPLPAPQDATECGLQAVCPAVFEYVPCPQDAHVASALLV